MMRPGLLIFALLTLAGLAQAQTGSVVSAAYPQEPVLWLPIAGDAVLEQRFAVHLAAGANTIAFAFGRLEIALDALDYEVLPGEAATVSQVTLAPDARDTVRMELTSAEDRDATVVLSYPLKGIERRVAYSTLLTPGTDAVGVTAKLVLSNKSKLVFPSAKLVLPGGTEVVTPLPQNETFEVTLFSSPVVPYKPVFIYDPPKYGGSVVAVLRVARDGADAFSATPLQAGKISFATGATATSWVGEDNVPYLPPHEPVDLRVGAVTDVSAGRRLVRSAQVDMKSDVRDRLVLYSVEEDVDLDVRNGRTTPVQVILRDAISGPCTILRSSVPGERISAETIEFVVDLAPGEAKTVSYFLKRNNVQP